MLKNSKTRSVIFRFSSEIVFYPSNLPTSPTFLFIILNHRISAIADIFNPKKTAHISPTFILNILSPFFCYFKEKKSLKCILIYFWVFSSLLKITFLPMCLVYLKIEYLDDFRARQLSFDLQLFVNEFFFCSKQNHTLQSQ